MAFDKKTWANNQGGGTPLDASGLNDLESRIDDSIDELDIDLASHKAESASKHITESGSNASGSYIKFDDGTMICTKKVTITAAITRPWGSVYSMGQKSIGATAATFAETPVFSAFCSSVGASVWLVVGHTESGNTQRYPTVDLVRPTAISEVLSYVVTTIAIGRWK